MIDHADMVDKMNAKQTISTPTGVIPAKTYPGQDKDNPIAVVQNILVANAKYGRPGGLRHRQDLHREASDDLVAVQREAKSIELENQERRKLADPVAPRRGEIFRRKGHEDVTRALRSSRPPGLDPGTTEDASSKGMERRIGPDRARP